MQTNSASPQGTTLYFIDWEYAHLDHTACDLGQMIGDIYERRHSGNAKAIIEGLMCGYGHMSDDLAFRTAIHTGVHLVCWYIRGPKQTSMVVSEDQVRDIIKAGVDLIVRGWKKDRQWFGDSLLAPLFGKSEL
jgi:hypothetical protein